MAGSELQKLRDTAHRFLASSRGKLFGLHPINSNISSNFHLHLVQVYIHRSQAIVMATVVPADIQADAAPTSHTLSDMDRYCLGEALKSAEQGMSEGGIPIGSVVSPYCVLVRESVI